MKIRRKAWTERKMADWPINNTGKHCPWSTVHIRIFVCICLHEHITCKCQFQCAHIVLILDDGLCERVWVSRRQCHVYVYFDYCTHPMLRHLNVVRHSDWWPSIMHMAGGSGNPRYHQGQSVCPCWKPPSPQTDSFNFQSDEEEKMKKKMAD